MPLVIFEAILITSTLSIDAFVASFAYGSNKIRIPFLQINIINIICSLVLVFSLLVGNIIRDIVPLWLTTWLSFTILFSIGLIKLISGITSKNDYALINKKIMSISPMEATILAFALSLDGFAIGFGIALVNTNILTILITSLIIGFIAILLGCYLGNKIAKNLKSNLSWLSGLLLIGLAFLSL